MARGIGRQRGLGCPSRPSIVNAPPDPPGSAGHPGPENAYRSPSPAASTARAIEAVWRIEAPKLIASLARIVRDVGLAEDLAQDALVVALEKWPESGVPDKPGAWLMAKALYDGLVEIAPSPVVALKRAVAVGMAFGPAAGLELADELREEPSLQAYHLLPSVRGDLLVKLGRSQEARSEFERAANLTRNARERALLLDRAAGCSATG